MKAGYLQFRHKVQIRRSVICTSKAERSEGEWGRDEGLGSSGPQRNVRSHHCKPSRRLPRRSHFVATPRKDEGRGNPAPTVGSAKEKWAVCKPPLPLESSLPLSALCFSTQGWAGDGGFSTAPKRSACGERIGGQIMKFEDGPSLCGGRFGGTMQIVVRRQNAPTRWCFYWAAPRNETSRQRGPGLSPGKKKRGNHPNAV